MANNQKADGLGLIPIHHRYLPKVRQAPKRRIKLPRVKNIRLIIAEMGSKKALLDTEINRLKPLDIEFPNPPRQMRIAWVKNSTVCILLKGSK